MFFVCPALLGSVTMSLILGKLIFIGILAIFFSVYFGYPSLVRYRAQETLISETKVKFKTNEPPAITITARKRESKKGKGGICPGHFCGSHSFKVVLDP